MFLLVPNVKVKWILFIFVKYFFVISTVYTTNDDSFLSKNLIDKICNSYVMNCQHVGFFAQGADRPTVTSE